MRNTCILEANSDIEIEYPLIIMNYLSVSMGIIKTIIYICVSD